MEEKTLKESLEIDERKSENKSDQIIQKRKVKSSKNRQWSASKKSAKKRKNE